MQFEGTTYRPPPESDTMLLQVTVGCAHNRCRFCAMYRDVQFQRVPMDQIEADLAEARDIYTRAERIFLVNGDAFVMKADRIARIAERIHHHFPECRTIAMYASIRNIQAKTDQELKDLRSLGINDLYVGVESGWDDVLARIGKGHTVAEARRQLGRLHDAGIDHIANLMLGVAGRGGGLENARHTAAFLNDTRPKMIWVGALAIFEGTELYDDLQNGRFIPATEREILDEEKALIGQLTLEDVRLYGVHPTNTVRISGRLPGDKSAMMAAIDKGIDHYGEGGLDTVFDRTSL